MAASDASAATPAAVPELRPRSVLDLLDATVRLYRRHFGTLLAISTVMLLPFGVVYTIGDFCLMQAFQPMFTTGTIPTDFSPPAGLLRTGIAGFSLALLIAWIAGPLTQGALALAISEQYLGRGITVREAYRRALPYWGSLFLVSIVFGLIVMIAPLGFTLLGAAIGIPVAIYGNSQTAILVAVLAGTLGLTAGLPVSVMFTIRFFLYDTVMVIERIRGIDSMQRARALVAGFGWHAFGAMLLAGLGTGIVTAVIGAPVSIAASVIATYNKDLLPQMHLLSSCVQQTLAVLLGPFMMIVQTLLYYDLRIRKEGFDLQMMAEALGGRQVTGKTTGNGQGATGNGEGPADGMAGASGS